MQKEEDEDKTKHAAEGITAAAEGTKEEKRGGNYRTFVVKDG